VADTAGFNVADGCVDPEDSPVEHYKDILNAGLGMAYSNLAKVLAEEALATIPFLESRGAEFQKDPETRRYLEVVGCFASRPRMHILKGHGEPIVRALTSEIREAPIKVFEDTLVLELLTSDGRVTGAVGVDRDGRSIIFRTKALILATGGASQLFKYTLTPPDITGDGYALGLKAGAQLVNMEFMQVVLGTVAPSKTQLNTFLWCARPKLTNAKNEEFLGRYLPSVVTIDEAMAAKSKHFPFSSRDNSRFIEIGVQTEILEGRGTTNGAVYLDLTTITDERVKALSADSPLRKVWPFVKEFMNRRGLAPGAKPVEIGCFAHAINGGLKIDEFGRTSVAGLYAAGEVAGGPHGADRLGGNMLLTCQVFGARAGRHAAEFAARSTSSPVPKRAEEVCTGLASLLGKPGLCTPREVKRKLQEAMWRGVLVVRTAGSLNRTLEELNSLEAELPNVKLEDGESLIAFFELQNLLLAGRAIIQAALHRKESRGSHYRADYPLLRPDYGRPLLLTMDDAGLQVQEEQ
jgi:succinate dehydrogenase/fumarate reductase flavoprotein subunit